MRKQRAELKAKAKESLPDVSDQAVDTNGTEGHSEVQGPVHTLSGTNGMPTPHRPEVGDDGSRSGE